MSLKTFLFLLILAEAAFAFQGIQPKQKYLDPNLTQAAPSVSLFSAESIKSGDYVEIKGAEWKACRRSRVSVQPFSKANDPLELFLEAQVTLKSLEKIEERNLRKSELKNKPWSGDYWAIAGGILGARYMDRDFGLNFDWIDKYKFVQENPASRLIEEKGQEAINTLSAAEKYDLLTGDSDFSFTTSQWAEGKKYYERTGEVESWMGICHGWAPAAIAEPKPSQSVELQSLDQKWKIHLNPSEIKGLVSYSWATNPFPVVTLGNRCNEKDPHRDENGRITDPKCFDLNPSTWHLATVHRIGLQKRSFIMDATFDYEVWNQPMYAYSYEYFNVETGIKTENLSEAKLQRAQITKDPYAKYRSSETHSIVGISMKVAYVVENSAGDETESSEEDDILHWVNYEYDLELNSQGEIIGGEWREHSHPDFIWTPKKGARPQSPFDFSISGNEWLDGLTIPNHWSKAAQKGSGRGQILNSITEGILKRATPSRP